MEKDNSLGVSHKNVTKNATQSNAKGSLKQTTKGAVEDGSYELMTPSGLAGSGLSGINRRANDSASKMVGGGGGAKNQSSRAGVEGNAPRWSNDSANKNFGA
jgi:hypothetical protein